MQSTRSVILVVEDDEVLRDTLQDLLTDAGYAVVGAADGRAALDHVAASGVDLVVLDVLLPEFDGVALCRALRARPPDENYLPILMLTGLTGEAARRAGFAAGADDYVAKPCDAADLLDRVAVWMRTRARLAEASARLRHERTTSARLAEERAEALAAMHTAHERVLAGQAEEARLRREAEARTRSFRVLHEVSVAVGGVLDPTALAQLAADRARDLLNVDSVSVWWWDAEAACSRLAHGHVPSPEHIAHTFPPGGRGSRRRLRPRRARRGRRLSVLGARRPLGHRRRAPIGRRGADPGGRAQR